MLGATTAIQAQTNTAEIVGAVKDSLGGVLPGVTLVAEHQATGFKLERVTDSAGKFLFPQLPVGEYSISAQLAGFKRHSRQGIVLQLGQVLKLEL